MVWQEDTRVIVMTTKEQEKGKAKCVKYWPDLDATESFGHFTIKNVEENESKDYTLREFLVSKSKSEERRIFHYHFQVRILNFELKIRQITYVAFHHCRLTRFLTLLFSFHLSRLGQIMEYLAIPDAS